MAFSCIKFFRNIRYRSDIILRYHRMSTSATTEVKHGAAKQYRTETNIQYLEDPDSFGTLAGRLPIPEVLEDVGDIKEEQYLKNIPLKSQKLTIKQYSDLIKQYLKHKRIKEAIDILEIRMLKEDRVKPENYIYNILIGACAEVGYTKKAFKLFNEMKRRALKPTGDTYTCLFEACITSPWATDGLKMATYLRNHMIEKGIEPNLTNYNVMIKAFGRCSDIYTAFKIVDEMISKNIKIRVHTFNHLLHACISNKEYGLKHALIVWRKMLKMKEKPNIYSFNLMLKCVKDCNLGSKNDMLDVISLVQEHMSLLNMTNSMIKINKSCIPSNQGDGGLNSLLIKIPNSAQEVIIKDTTDCDRFDENNKRNTIQNQESKDLSVNMNNIVNLKLLENYNGATPKMPQRNVPNLLSKVVQIDKILAFKEVHTLQDKFAIIGGQEDFLNEMEVYSVKPDKKTLTQMLPLIEDNLEAENKLLETMKMLNIKSDIDFYNALIKKRCLRQDYASAFEVRGYIEKQNKFRKTHPLNKKNIIKMNIITYGVLALGCRTREMAEELLNEMKDKQLKVNIEILGTLLKSATFQLQFGYILYIMDTIQKENIRVNDILLKHLQEFNDQCHKIIQKNEQEHRDSRVFMAAYKRFSNIYNKWLKEINVEEILKPEHPWQQFIEPHPTPVQRENINILEPRKFYKRNRKFVHYKPRM